MTTIGLSYSLVKISTKCAPALHRKEFFYAKPSEVKAEMDKLGIESDWYFDVDAKEYLESQLIRAAMAHQAVDIAASASLPDSI